MSLPVERFLVDFHNRMPGGSSQAFNALQVQDAQGQPLADTYQALVDALAAADVPDGSLPDTALPDGPVLDLACGDGLLLARLQASGHTVLGADLSAGELAAARARLGQSVPLHQARAQALPLASASIAAITCHMALMLMAQPSAVVAELARVLRPGGRLLAVVPAAPTASTPNGTPAGTSTDPVSAAFTAAMAGHARLPDWQDLRFEGRAWRDPAALATLLQPAFNAPRITHLAGQHSFTPHQAWAWFVGLYDLHLLPHTAWPAVQANLLTRLAPLCNAAGQVTLPHAYLLIDATRAA